MRSLINALLMLSKESGNYTWVLLLATIAIVAIWLVEKFFWLVDKLQEKTFRLAPDAIAPDAI
jgi:hypothetical protein